MADRSTRRLTTIDASNVKLDIASDGSRIVLLIDGALAYVDLDNAEELEANLVRVAVDQNLEVSPHDRRLAVFDHLVNLVRRRFYKPGMLDADWEAGVHHYRNKLSNIAHDRDLATIWSELIGELNVSHASTALLQDTEKNGAELAALGLFIDTSYDGAGLEIEEVLPGGPLDGLLEERGAGTVLTAVDGEPVTRNTNFYSLLHDRYGSRIDLTFRGSDNSTFSFEVDPITLEEQRRLLYDRWTDRLRVRVEELSAGRIGYSHLPRMNDDSFRHMYDDVFGRYNDRDALVIDTRFNTGGSITEDLTKVFSGSPLFWGFSRQPRSLTYPYTRWTKPIIVLVNASNYSDAYLMPMAFQSLGLATVVGDSVPGTGVGAYWEEVIGANIEVMIPQFGMQDNSGRDLEGLEFTPDIRVLNSPQDVSAGHDEQLEYAVRLLLQKLRSRN